MLVCAASIIVHAQSPVDSVKAAVNNLFTAMKTSNATGITAAFAEGAILQTISTKDGNVKVESASIEDFANSISKIAPGDADERISFDMVKVDADLAIAWTPYQFYYKGSFSHCGVNSFQLVRVSGEWKIQYIIDTRRRESCL